MKILQKRQTQLKYLNARLLPKQWYRSTGLDERAHMIIDVNYLRQIVDAKYCISQANE
jgi:hypothetical protein